MNYDPNVYEAQHYLWVLFEYGEPIPPVLPDGYFSHGTAEAVKAYQLLAGLPVTGAIDHETWDHLYDDYLLVMYRCEKSCGIYPFETVLENGCLSVGDRADTVYILQVILQSLASVYAGMGKQPIDGIYGEATAENVAEFQRKNLLPDSGVVDKETWNRLADAYNHYINME